MAEGASDDDAACPRSFLDDVDDVVSAASIAGAAAQAPALFAVRREKEEYVGTVTPEICEQIARGAIGKAWSRSVSLSDLRHLVSALTSPSCKLTELRCVPSPLR